MVVNAYGMELTKLLSFDGRSSLMRSESWTWIMKEQFDKESQEVIKSFDLAVQEKKWILFPIITPGRDHDSDPDHWTLLVYDTIGQRSKGVWKFYNSMKPKKGSTDHYSLATTEMKELVAALSSLVIGSHFFYVDGITQQGDRSECAIYVCYYMTKLLFHEPIESELSVEQVNEFKAHVIESIVKQD